MTIIKEDHRVRVAKIRRKKMRQRLLRAVMACFARGERQIDAVIVEAGTSRATFYKYFDSVDEAVDAAGDDLRTELRKDIRVLVDETADPLGRISAGIQIFLIRSVMDPVWGAFVSQTNYLETDEDHRSIIAEQLTLARSQEIIQFEDIDAAISLLLGALLQAAHHLAFSGVRKREYVEELNVLILRAFGVPLDRARNIVRDRVIYVRGLAPDHLSWWRDPWT